jgi:hypothetical protein
MSQVLPYLSPAPPSSSLFLSLPLFFCLMLRTVKCPRRVFLETREFCGLFQNAVSGIVLQSILEHSGLRIELFCLDGGSEVGLFLTKDLVNARDGYTNFYASSLA